MKLRKLNRAIHRDLGYFFAAMSIIYGLSGIALNHLNDWNPSYKVVNKIIQHEITEANNINDAFVMNLTERFKEPKYQKYYFPETDRLKIFIPGGAINYSLISGEAALEKLEKRRVFYEFNFLHYNNAKRLWTWFSDAYAIGLIILAISGLFILKGKNGITRRGAWLTIAGILIPLIFILVYL